MLCVLLPAAAAGPAAAQEKAVRPDGAFETLALGAAAAAQVNHNALSTAWAPPRGGEVHLQTPFYAGRVQAGLQVFPFERRREDLAGFTGWYAFLDWRLPVRLPWKLQASGGGRLGVFGMHFDDPDVAPQLRTEQEVRVDLVAGLERDINRKWMVFMTVSSGTVFFHEPVRQVLITGGLRRVFRTPAWVREVLR